jgi:hypothetical protein
VIKSHYRITGYERPGAGCGLLYLSEIYRIIFITWILLCGLLFLMWNWNTSRVKRHFHVWIFCRERPYRNSVSLLIYHSYPFLPYPYVIYLYPFRRYFCLSYIYLYLPNLYRVIFLTLIFLIFTFFASFVILFNFLSWYLNLYILYDILRHCTMF